MCKCVSVKSASVQVCECAYMHRCKCANVQVCKCASMQESQPMQSLNVSRFFSVSTRLMAIGLVFLLRPFPFKWQTIKKGKNFNGIFMPDRSLTIGGKKFCQTDLPILSFP